jgi:MFS family permease
VGWIVGYILLLWLVVAALAELRRPLEGRGRRLVVTAAEYTIQTLHHNLLLFVLPAYFAAATLTSVNGLFVAAVAGAALLTAVDPWYGALVRRFSWVNDALLAFSSFAALNVALALVGLPPILALVGSAGLSGLGLAPVFRRAGAVAWRHAFALAGVVALLAVVVVWLARGAVPPAPLFMARAAIARDVVQLEPVDEVRGVAAYTAIYAPAGIRQSVDHVWRRDGHVVARVALSPILGGRTAGFRTWSRRADLRPPLAGRYTVDVVTSSGQLVGRLRFSVTP